MGVAQLDLPRSTPREPLALEAGRGGSHGAGEEGREGPSGPRPSPEDHAFLLAMFCLFTILGLG